MGSSNVPFSFQANLDVTDSLPLSHWSWDENRAGTSAHTFSKRTTDDDFSLERDTPAVEGSADSPHLRPTELAQTRSEQKGSRRPRKLWTQAVSYSFALGVLLAFFLTHRFRLWTRLSPGVAPLDLPSDTLLDEFINKFVTAKDPTCFTDHRSFAAETPEAKAASGSFQEWVRKAKRWRDAAKSRNSAADDGISGARESGLDAAETAERWELLLLQGALICYDLPEMEANAGFSPYFALRHGRYDYKEEGGQLELSAAPAGKAKTPILRKTQEALRANAAQVKVWVARMQKELQELAAAKTEQMRTISTAAPREKAEQELKELGQALAFYEKLRIYAEEREPPPPLADGAPAADYLRAVDRFVLRTSTDAANALCCVPGGAESNDKKQPSSLFISSSNKYIPYWLPHLLLSRQRETSQVHVGLRLQVAAMGLPTFAAADRASLSEFVELLNRTLVHEEEKQQLELLILDSLDKRRLQRHLQLNQMHTALAAATSMIQFHKDALTTAEKQENTSVEVLAKLRSAVAAAQGRQAAIALDWMNKAKEGEFLLPKKDAEELAAALQHVFNGALLSRTLTQAQQRKTVEAADQRHLLTTAGLLASCQLKIAAAARGDLHNKGIFPAWFAHIV